MQTLTVGPRKRDLPSHADLLLVTWFAIWRFHPHVREMLFVSFCHVIGTGFSRLLFAILQKVRILNLISRMDLIRSVKDGGMFLHLYLCNFKINCFDMFWLMIRIAKLHRYLPIFLGNGKSPGSLGKESAPQICADVFATNIHPLGITFSGSSSFRTVLLHLPCLLT